MEYKGTHILVLGAGVSGIGVAHIVAGLGAHVVLNDYKQVSFDKKTEHLLEESGVEVITGRQDFSLLDGVERIIVSPGIALTIPILEEAKRRHIEIVGEVELAYEISKAPILAVTGTNGKTTTTTLLAEVVKAAGKPVFVGGNIGLSLSEAAHKATEDGYVVAELSSYQLESSVTFRPKGGIMLNITPDHLQRHKTMEAYQYAKEAIFRRQRADDFMVLNIDDPIVADMAMRVPGKVLSISQQRRVTDGAFFENGVCYAVQNGKPDPVVTVKEIHIPGAHNVENILAIVALSYALGFSKESIVSAIDSFNGVEHRIEKVTTYKGITYYNDSKATNTDSAIKALDAFHQPVILLAGGHDKMTPLEDFMAKVKSNTKAVIFMGEAANRFTQAAITAGVTNIYRADSMEEAVTMGADLATEGDVVLLSPACSSFDWYHCFEERGDDFKQCVHEMAKKGATE